MGSKFSRLCAKKEVGPADAYKKITLDDFTIMRAIGKGAFGKVSPLLAPVVATSAVA